MQIDPNRGDGSATALFDGEHRSTLTDLPESYLASFAAMVNP